MRGILIERMPCPMLEIIGGLNDYYPTEPSYHGVGLAGDSRFMSQTPRTGVWCSADVCSRCCCLRC